MNIETRKDLSSYFYQTLLKKSELEEPDEKVDLKPKSFIIESNVDIESSNFGQFGLTLKKTKDADLFVINYKSQEFFIDTFDKRFWLIHTLCPSETAKEFIHSILSRKNSRLDSIWLSSSVLNKIGKLGQQTSFGLKFENKFLNNEDKEIERISMRFWGGPAQEIIDDLQENNTIKQAVTFSSIGLKYSPSSNFFIKNDITYNGRFTVKNGDAIEPYFHLINRVKDIYSNLLKTIEEKYRFIHFKSNERRYFKGDFLVIAFSKPLEHMETFIETLISCKLPFQIWGIWNKLGEDYIKANCIDMHTGHKFYLELTKEWMRIYLDTDTCGNVVARLFTNLQQFFDSRIELYGAENDRIM